MCSYLCYYWLSVCPSSLARGLTKGLHYAKFSSSLSKRTKYSLILTWLVIKIKYKIYMYIYTSFTGRQYVVRPSWQEVRRRRWSTSRARTRYRSASGQTQITFLSFYTDRGLSCFSRLWNYSWNYFFPTISFFTKK